MCVQLCVYMLMQTTTLRGERNSLCAMVMDNHRCNPTPAAVSPRNGGSR